MSVGDLETLKKFNCLSDLTGAYPVFIPTSLIVLPGWGEGLQIHRILARIMMLNKDK